LIEPTRVGIYNVGQRSIMSDDPFPFFSVPCKQEFAFLVDRYGFSGPEVEDFGRECVIRYQKGKKTVAIAYEVGVGPIVELFFPSRDIKNRRFPRHTAITNSTQKKKLRRWEDEMLPAFLTLHAAELERNERDFLEKAE